MIHLKLTRTLILPGLAAFLAGLTSLTAAESSLRWSDEFNQEVGSRPNPANWVYDLGNGEGWGNQELQHYTDDAANCSVVADAGALDGKALAITARKTSEGYTSARVKTLGRQSFTYGRIEGRLKLPRGQGIWPAFWMLGANIPEVNWPACGEIDVMEMLGHEPQKLYGTLHGPGYSGPKGFSQSVLAPNGASLADDYHVYSVEWRPGHIRWFLDGQLYHEVKASAAPEGNWVFDGKPQFILLNLAVGGGWPGYPDQTTVFPQTYLIDHVRVYDLGDTPKP